MSSPISHGAFWFRGPNHSIDSFCPPNRPIRGQINAKRVTCPQYRPIRGQSNAKRVTCPQYRPFCGQSNLINAVCPRKLGFRGQTCTLAGLLLTQCLDSASSLSARQHLRSVLEIGIDVPVVLVLIDVSHGNDHGCVVAVAEVGVECGSEGLHRV